MNKKQTKQTYPPGWGRAWRSIRLETLFETMPRRGALSLTAEQTGSVAVRDDGDGRLLNGDGVEVGTVDYETRIAHVGCLLKEGDLPGKPAAQ